MRIASLGLVGFGDEIQYKRSTRGTTVYGFRVYAGCYDLQYGFGFVLGGFLRKARAVLRRDGSRCCYSGVPAPGIRSLQPVSLVSQNPLSSKPKKNPKPKIQNPQNRSTLNPKPKIQNPQNHSTLNPKPKLVLPPCSSVTQLRYRKPKL